MSSTFHGLPALAGVATALIIGGYCKPNRPGDDGQEALFESMREDYSNQSKPSPEREKGIRL